MATIVSGARSTTDLSTYRLRVDLADRISLLDPNVNPMTLLSKKVGKVTATQPKHSWLEDELRPEVDQINYTTAYASTATALTVDNYSYFAAGDLWQVFDSYEIMLVVSASSDGIVNFTRNWTSRSAGETGIGTALADNDYLIRIGNVNEEGATSPASVTVQETQVDNYTQIFRTPYELTETELNSLMHGDQDLPYQTKKKGIEHARSIEYAFIWGLPRVTTGSNSKPMRSMGGAWWFLKENAPSGNLASQAEITKAEFLTWLRNCFRYGSSRKVLYACPLILSAIESWGLADLQTRSSDKTYGIAITNWTSPHGEVAIINHKMLEGPAPGTAGGWAFLLDMEQVKYVALRNRDTKLLTNRQANDADSYKAEYLTECSMEIKLPKHHGVLYNVTSFAA